MKLKAIEPTCGGLTPSSQARKYLVPRDAKVVTDSDGCRVHKAYTFAFPTTVDEVGQQGKLYPGHQLHETIVADKIRKLRVQFIADVTYVIGFEVSIVGLVKVNHDGHDLTHR
jgi:hypothetical protein